MLIGITGTPLSGRHTVLAALKTKGFSEIECNESTFESLVPQWRDDFVVIIPGEPSSISKRPWFLHVHVDAHFSVRQQRAEGKGLPLDIESDVAEMPANIANVRNAHINLLNNFSSIEELENHLDTIDFRDKQRVRPNWDSYFMTLANLASQRSNCMKRRVGCVLVKDDKILATGYNGTSRKSINCNEGGCPRCNSGSRGGSLLSTCLCLHAEENALLEVGRSRAVGSILYCNTCPCLTCSIKIVQTGVTEVVYSQEYSMDAETHGVFERSGVKLRRIVV